MVGLFRQKINEFNPRTSSDVATKQPGCLALELVPVNPRRWCCRCAVILCPHWRIKFSIFLEMSGSRVGYVVQYTMRVAQMEKMFKKLITHLNTNRLRMIRLAEHITLCIVCCLS